MLTVLRGAIALLLSTTLAAGCHGAMPGATPIGASMTLGAVSAAQVVDALLGKGGASWQDATMTYPPLLARRAAKGYRLQATATGATWTVSLPAVSTSAMAYRRQSMDSYEGPNPRGGESVYVLTESAAETPQVFRLAATDGATLNGAGWDALAGLSAPGTFQRTAVLLSGDGRRLYMLTSGGYFLCLDADTGERLFAKKLSNSGFSGTAPFIDYSNGGGWPQSYVGADEFLYAVSKDGSVFRVRVQNHSGYTVAAWPAAGGSDASLWAGRPTIPYGQATGVNAFPVAWQSRLYVGTTDGRCVRVDLTSDTPKLTTWRPDLLTSAGYRGITAPVAIDFDGNFAVSHIFVACGDRLVWIDPAKTPLEEAAVASPPLVLTQTSPVQGPLSAHPYAAPLVKGPYDCIDFASIASKANPAPSRWGNGAGIDGRLYGADGYTTPTDGNGSRGYMQFELPVGDFAGYSPTGGRIDLSSAQNTASEETVQVWRASNYMAGTSAFWSGFNFTTDIDWNNRPNLLSGALGGYKGSVSSSDATTGLPRFGLKLNDALPVDRPNVEGRSWHPFAMVSVGKQRLGPPSAPESGESAKWHRAVDGDNKTEPKLFVTLDTAAKTPAASGVQTQPSLDSLGRKVWVVASNALFELSYADANTFQAKSGVTYSLTAAGRSAGPTVAGTPRRYVMPKGNVLFTGARLLVADADPASNRFFLNTFDPTLAGASDSLLHHHEAAAGAAQIGEQMLFDYYAGSAYMTTRAKAVTRVDIF